MDDDDEAHLRLFSRILFNLAKDATFNALHTALPFTWDQEEPYDTVNPFGDFLQVDHEDLWIFDIENDAPPHTNRQHHKGVSLASLRSRPVTLADMEPLGLSVPLHLDPMMDSIIPSWKPRVQVDRSFRAFTHRILRDFNHQWMYILRNDYNTITIRILARAILWLSTLQFDVREETKSRHGQLGSYVSTTELLKWKSLQDDTIASTTNSN